MAVKVPLYNSDGYGSCQFCGFPTSPQLLTFFDGKWVCRYHRFKHTRAELEADFTRSVRKYRNFIFIENSLGPIPGGVTPPTTTPPSEGGGGSIPPPNPGGGGGGTNPPPDTPPGGIPIGATEGNLCLK
jgi:hypothetical protein